MENYVFRVWLPCPSFHWHYSVSQTYYKARNTTILLNATIKNEKKWNIGPADLSNPVVISKTKTCLLVLKTGEAPLVTFSFNIITIPLKSAPCLNCLMQFQSAADIFTELLIELLTVYHGALITVSGEKGKFKTCRKQCKHFTALAWILLTSFAEVIPLFAGKLAWVREFWNCLPNSSGIWPKFYMGKQHFKRQVC